MICVKAVSKLNIFMIVHMNSMSSKINTHGMLEPERTEHLIFYMLLAHCNNRYKANLAQTHRICDGDYILEFISHYSDETLSYLANISLITLNEQPQTVKF